MHGEWEVPHDLILSEIGTLNLNAIDPTTHLCYLLDPAGCKAQLPVRVTQDDRPQSDGAIPHRRWRSGYGVHLAIEMVKDNAGEFEGACDEDLTDMLDTLGLFLNAMIRTGLVAGLPNARLSWTPTNKAARMFDRLQLASAPDLEVIEGKVGPRVEVDFDTPYPYYISVTEETTVIGATGSEIITNDGNTDFFPVLKIYGPASLVTVTNLDAVDTDGNPLYLVYDSSLPGGASIGGGDYVEVSHFTSLAYLNGNQANRKANIDMTQTTFFPLVPGDNEILVTGGSVTVLSSDAWA